jgi:hypothetical protein
MLGACLELGVWSLGFGLWGLVCGVFPAGTLTANKESRLKQMATKVKVMKLLQEMRGFADVTNRRPSPRTPGLFLLQIRSHVLHATDGRGKRTISVDVQNPLDIPHPIKIKHLEARPRTRASTSAS